MMPQDFPDLESWHKTLDDLESEMYYPGFFDYSYEHYNPEDDTVNYIIRGFTTRGSNLQVLMQIKDDNCSGCWDCSPNTNQESYWTNHRMMTQQNIKYYWSLPVYAYDIDISQYLNNDTKRAHP